MTGSPAMAEGPAGRFACKPSGTGICGEVCVGGGIIGADHVLLRLDTRDGLISLNRLTGTMSAEVDDKGGRAVGWEWGLIGYTRLSLRENEHLVTATLAGADSGRFLEFTCQPSRRGPDRRPIPRVED